MSSMRIVLVDPLGDVLFSGESWVANGPERARNDAQEAEPEPDEDDDCPETMRSGESGIFPVERARPANAHGSNAAPGAPKRDERAA